MWRIGEYRYFSQISALMYKAQREHKQLTIYQPWALSITYYEEGFRIIWRLLIDERAVRVGNKTESRISTAYYRRTQSQLVLY